MSYYANFPTQYRITNDGATCYYDQLGEANQVWDRLLEKAKEGYTLRCEMWQDVTMPWDEKTYLSILDPNTGKVPTDRYLVILNRAIIVRTRTRALITQ